MANPLGNDSLVQCFDVMTGQGHAAAGRQGLTCQHFGQSAAVFVIRGCYADGGARRKSDRDVFEHRVAVAVAHGHLIQDHIAGEAGDLS